MATKTYNNNTAEPKVKIGNWAEERYWAETAQDAVCSSGYQVYSYWSE